MRILWCSNFTSQSGYATQARLFVPRLKQAGHDVTVFELGGGGGMPREVAGIQVIPTYQDNLGADMLLAHAERLKADCVMTLVDAWGMRPQIMAQTNWVPLAPIDHTPVPPAVLDSLKAAKVPVAYSRFGVEEMRKVGLNPLYVPHAVDPAVFYPRDKAQARRALGIGEQTFFVAFVGVNDSVPSRKGIPELLTAWSIFAPHYPDAVLYMHTSEQGNLPVNNVGGVRIDRLFDTLNIDVSRVKMPDAYRYKTGIPSSELATIYSAADVLVLPTMGEGFGLPLIEAQRCGTPVITTNFAAGAELCASGWTLDYEPTWTWQSAFAAKPSVVSIVERLEQAYAERDNPRYRAEAVAFARDYDIDVVMQRYMLPAMRQIGEVLLDGVRVT